MAERDDFEQAGQQMSQLINSLWQWHEGDFCPVESWAPPINVYQLADYVEMCVDLSGVDPATVQISVESFRVMIRGVRLAPEPKLTGVQAQVRILAMEIDHGPFCRLVDLPFAVSNRRMTWDYEDGILRLKVPIARPGPKSIRG